METCDALDIGCYLDWVFQELEIFFVWVFGSILDGLLAVISAIPVPDFLQNIQPVVLPDYMAFLATLLEIKFGLIVLVSAFTIRFIIRRLPVIG